MTSILDPPYHIIHRCQFSTAVSKGNHLWEFLLELLRNEQFTPSHIKWENRPLGVFRIVKSAEVAKMWGARKNRPKMNYEKLSRALR